MASKEEKEAALDAKIAAIRLKNQGISKKFAEVEADKKSAALQAESETDKSAAESEAVKSAKPRPRGRGRGLRGTPKQPAPGESGTAHNDWQHERERIDKERLARAQDTTGMWTREWDADKPKCGDPQSGVGREVRRSPPNAQTKQTSPSLATESVKISFKSDFDDRKEVTPPPVSREEPKRHSGRRRSGETYTPPHLRQKNVEKTPPANESQRENTKTNGVDEHSDAIEQQKPKVEDTQDLPTEHSNNNNAAIKETNDNDNQPVSSIGLEAASEGIKDQESPLVSPVLPAVVRGSRTESMDRIEREMIEKLHANILAAEAVLDESDEEELDQILYGSCSKRNENKGVKFESQLESMVDNSVALCIEEVLQEVESMAQF